MSLHNRPKSFFAENAAEQCALLGADLLAGPYTKAMEAASSIVNQSVRDNFTSSVTPDGSEWAPRKHVGDGHPLGMDTGALLQAATDGGSGHIERLEPFGLQKGVQGEEVPYAGFFSGGTSKMPPREFMGLNESGKDAVADLLGAFVMQEIFG